MVRCSLEEKNYFKFTRAILFYYGLTKSIFTGKQQRPYVIEILFLLCARYLSKSSRTISNFEKCAKSFSVANCTDNRVYVMGTASELMNATKCYKMLSKKINYLKFFGSVLFHYGLTILNLFVSAQFVCKCWFVINCGEILFRYRNVT